MLDNLENLYFSFDNAGKGVYIQKNSLSKFSTKLPLRFEECHIAVSTNGGLMVYVKRPDYLILGRDKLIVENILAFAQNGALLINIPYGSNIKFKNIVLFDFDENEKLFIFNDVGEYQTIDIFNKIIKRRSLGQTFQRENIISGRLFSKRFVALTNNNAIYYIPDLKVPSPSLFFSSEQISNFGEIVIQEISDYIVIPPNKSASQKMEVLLCSPQIPGVVRAIEGPRGMIPTQNENELILDNTYIIYNSISEPFLIFGNKRRTKESDFGSIDSLAMSAKGNKIAFYKKGGSVILFDSTLDKDLDENPRIVFSFKVSTRLSKYSKEEQQRMLNLENDTQFMFCGEKAVCLVGKRLIMIAHSEGSNTIVYEMSKKQNQDTQYLFAKSEIDGLRVITPEETYFISEVDANLIGICSPFSEETGKRLIDAYNAKINKLPSSDCDLNIMQEDLISAIDQLLNISTQILDSDIQLFLLKAAKHGKTFTTPESYNHEKFSETCKTLRIVNSLKQNDNPRLITFEEYRFIQGKIIDLLTRNHNFAMADEIAKFLEVSNTRIYYKFILAHVKQLPSTTTIEKQDALFDEINRLFDKVSDVPRLKLSQKCFALGWDHLGNKLLQTDKSSIGKIQELLKQGLWEEALDIVTPTYDSNIILPVLDKIIKSIDLHSFVKMTSKHNELYPYIKEYLKNNDTKSLDNYIDLTNQYEDYFYSKLESFYKSNSIEERHEIINSLQYCINKMKKDETKYEDLKFLQETVNNLKIDLEMKQLSYKENLIKNKDEFDINWSYYDIIKQAEEVSKIKNQLKQLMSSKLLKKNFNFMGLIILDRNNDHGIAKINNLLSNDKKLKEFYDINMFNIFDILYQQKDTKKIANVARKITEFGFIRYKVEVLKELG